ncbi:hypothetical protein GCM10018793_47870 [Streptomyces sulfonofaciens]|uniref:Uncharacterized protein n=1 Tax=Streptomyces sulfonofaciens TaxID=68272 RepID=A0A919GHQ8_9ACTN|nr:hypothetical protein [Streptomyces sulfonofaciens]GHH84180.1 hypothetical protein GCM10018793_47870 [Streptomyces sulfonofaciens]
MDYCHPCRRHLNGAYACPGCGTPAEDCRAYAETRADGTAAPVDGAWEGEEEAEDVRAGHRGRAGRRAVHRRKRRRALVVGAGLVLALGALSLAEIHIETPFRSADNASAPDGSDAAPADDGTPGGAGSSGSAPSAGAPEAGVTSAASSASGPDAEKGEDAKGGADGKGGGDGGKGGGDGRGEDTRPPAPGGTPTSAPGAPGGGSQDPPPPTASQPPPSQPRPSPSRSCTWVIVWVCD